MDRRSNVTALPTADPDKLRESVAKLQRNLPTILDAMPMLAQARKKAFDEHIAAGFTPEQAMEFTKKLI